MIQVKTRPHHLFFYDNQWWLTNGEHYIKIYLVNNAWCVVKAKALIVD